MTKRKTPKDNILKYEKSCVTSVWEKDDDLSIERITND